MTRLHSATSFPALRRTNAGIAPLCDGYSLLEVLIALIVLSVGLSGLASLILIGLKTNDSAMLRTQANTLAYDIVDRMRANRGRAGLGATAIGGGYNNVSLCNSSQRHPSDGRSCDDSGAFTGTSMATTDLSRWWTALDDAALWNWYARIERLAGNRFVVAVQWDDSRAKPDEEVKSTDTKAACYDAQASIPAQMEQVCMTTQL
ncbi:MAG: type IV pilus modification protein PilV [Pseudomonadota bacterium]|nr:type IV pilus modification protein PilV [Pseudomonadota bacterium]